VKRTGQPEPGSKDLPAAYPDYRGYPRTEIRGNLERSTRHPIRSLSRGDHRRRIRVKPEPETMEVSRNAPYQMFPPGKSGQPGLRVRIETLDASRLSGSSVPHSWATRKVGQGRPMAAVRISGPFRVLGPGQPDPCTWDGSDGWQKSIRSMTEGRTGQPALLEIMEKLDVQPLELPFGKPGQPGRTGSEGRMDEPLPGEHPGESRRATSFRPREGNLEASYARWISIIERKGATLHF
jgi:hypothetical protein